MKIKVWTATIDGGDGSSSIQFFPSLLKLRAELELDEDDFQPDYVERPVEIDWSILDTSEYEVVS